MADRLPHGRPRGRAPRSGSGGAPPWLAERRAARTAWRRYRDSPNRERMDRMLQGHAPEQDGQLELGRQEEFVVIDSDRNVVAGPFGCVSEAAGEWAADTFATFIRARDVDSGHMRRMNDRERAEADRVREAA
jgi:hypothetical protein